MKNCRLLTYSWHGENKHNLKRTFCQGTLCVDCSWHIRMKPSATETLENSQYKSCWDEPIQITDTCVSHGGGCAPGKSNLVATRNRGGHYQIQLPGEVLFSLCVVREQGKRLSYGQFKNAVMPVWPKAKRFTKNDACYLRLKVLPVCYLCIEKIMVTTKCSCLLTIILHS